jgi:hypothetical protein
MTPLEFLLVVPAFHLSDRGAWQELAVVELVDQQLLLYLAVVEVVAWMASPQLVQPTQALVAMAGQTQPLQALAAGTEAAVEGVLMALLRGVQ